MNRGLAGDFGLGLILPLVGDVQRGGNIDGHLGDLALHNSQQHWGSAQGNIRIHGFGHAGFLLLLPKRALNLVLHEPAEAELGEKQQQNNDKQESDKDLQPKLALLWLLLVHVLRWLAVRACLAIRALLPRLTELQLLVRLAQLPLRSAVPRAVLVRAVVAAIVAAGVPDSRLILVAAGIRGRVL